MKAICIKYICTQKYMNCGGKTKLKHLKKIWNFVYFLKLISIYE